MKEHILPYVATDVEKAIARALTSVQSVNGVSPDKNGNVTIETGNVSDEQIESVVESYLQKNPIDVPNAVLSVNGVLPDENGNVVIPVTGGENNEITILEETRYTGFNTNNEYQVPGVSIEPTPFELTVGLTYRIVWEGESYTCTAQDMSKLVTGAIALGNLTNFEGTGNNEPFVIAWLPIGVSFFCLTDNKTEHTVAIYQVAIESTLPEVTTDDVGKFLRVNADGCWAAETIPSAEGVGF